MITVINSQAFFSSIHKGIQFPITIPNRVLNGKELDEDILADAKARVLVYLDTHEKAYVPELSKALSIDPKLIVRALKQLAEEGVVSEDI